MSKLTLPNQSISKRKIREALYKFQKSREELLKTVTDQNWRAWLTSPSAWLQYVTAHYTSEQQKSISHYVLSYGGNEFYSIKHTIQAMYTGDTFHNLKSFNDMVAEHGSILK